MLYCLIYLIACTSCMIRVGCTFLLSVGLELKFESKDSLIVQVWH
jgi:hypothetical protein